MSIRNKYVEFGASFHELPDNVKLAIILTVYGAIGIILVVGLGLEGSPGGKIGPINTP